MTLFFYNSLSISQGLNMAALMKIKQQKENIKNNKREKNCMWYYQQ